MNQIIEEGSGEAYWKARVESQGKVWGAQADQGCAKMNVEDYSLKKPLPKQLLNLIVGDLI